MKRLISVKFPYRYKNYPLQINREELSTGDIFEIITEGKGHVVEHFGELGVILDLSNYNKVNILTSHTSDTTEEVKNEEKPEEEQTVTEEIKKPEELNEVHERVNYTRKRGK